MAWIGSIDHYQIIGLTGVLIYIINYALLQFGFIRGNGPVYPLLVLLGASAILVSMLSEFNLSSAVVNGIYVVISIAGITRIYVLEMRIHFSDAETELLQSHFPELSRKKARMLFDSGHWITAHTGTELTEQGVAVRNLVYIHSGSVSVVVDGKVVGAVKSGSFIGEVTALTGDPATATTMTSESATLFSIGAQKLRDIVKRDGELRAALESAFRADLRAKLVNANQANASKGG